MPLQSGEPAPRIDLPQELFPSAEWREGRLLVFDAQNRGDFMADVVCHFEQGEHAMDVRFGLFPGVRTRVVVPLRMLDSQVVIPGRTPHRFKCVCSGGPLDPSRLTAVRLWGRTAGGGADIVVSEPRLLDSFPDRWPAADRPIADRLHQWATREWPGKTRSIEGMRERLRRELEREPAERPEGLSPWGGWLEKRFDATGYFHAAHDGDRWWLVDPDGCAFYSVGVDCVRPRAAAETWGNEDLFSELPVRDGPYAEFWNTGRGPDSALFDGMGHNLARALGEDWRAQWMKLCRRRLVRWGFNTVGNWSDGEFCRSARLPYVWPLSGFPSTEKRIFRDFPDVFSEEYRRNSRAFAAQLEEFREDPFMVGYFLRNEPHWAFGTYNLAERMLRQDEQSASRERLVEWLGERHGDAAALNAAWGTDFASLEALTAGALREEHLASERARADLAEFNRLMIARYVRVPSEECRRVDPDHMNLGVRYAWIAHDDLLAGADTFDVFSINGYQASPDAAVVEKCSRAADAPVLIGEFHTGALDRGLPWGGLRMVRTQEERAASYRHYVEQGAAIPELVGAHYFLWNDQHVVGRFDGENWQIGLVDICQKPYAEVIEAARESHARIYRVAAGRADPFEGLPAAVEVR